MNEWNGDERRTKIDCRSEVWALRMIAGALIATNVAMLGALVVSGLKVTAATKNVEAGLRQHIEMTCTDLGNCTKQLHDYDQLGQDE